MTLVKPKVNEKLLCIDDPKRANAFKSNQLYVAVR